MASQGIRISEDAFKVVCGSLFGVAITAAVARTVIRYRNHTPRALDDVFLLLACAGLTGATVLCFVLIPGAWLFDELFAGRPVKMPADFGAFTTYYNSILDAYVAVTWIVLFAVKFCFLAFFRLLIDRLTRMIIYWRCVVVITAVLSILSLSENFIACPRINADSVTCIAGSGFDRTLLVSISAKCLDILTDILLLAIPVCLLWNVRIKTRQKLGVGAFLCLSSVMVIIACIKLSGLHKTGNSFDCLWKQLFWTQIEACVAVMMVSFTAFRSVFVSHKAKPPRTMGSPGYVRHSRFWPYKRRLADGGSLPLAKKQQQADCHLTLGTQFRDARKKGIMGSHFEKDMESQDLESATCASANRNTLNTEDPDTGWPLPHGVPRVVYKSNILNFQPGSETLSGSTRYCHENGKPHWWQKRVFTSITASRS